MSTHTVLRFGNARLQAAPGKPVPFRSNRQYALQQSCIQARGHAEEAPGMR
jgi:hypothetical protein